MDDVKYKEILLTDQLNENEEVLFKKIDEIVNFENYSDKSKLIEIKDDIKTSAVELKKHMLLLKQQLHKIYSLAKYTEMNLKENRMFILQIGVAKATVLNVGEFPSYDIIEKNKNKIPYIGKNYIIPINFSIKRRYKKYIDCKRKGETIFYTVTATEDGFTIKTEDNKKLYSGDNILEKINYDLNFEDKIKSLIEFCYLNTSQLRSKIELLGDVSEYSDYERI